jgi:cell division protein FtsX
MDREMHLENLAMVERHVAKGIRQVERQREIANKLERDGHPGAAHEARKLLTQFEEIQALHIAHRERILKKLAEDSES